MYVDDVLDSCETTQEAQVLQRELSDLLRKGGFSLRKWSSNEPLVLKDILYEDKLASLQIEHGNLPAQKTLGVLWRAEEDVFTFQVEIPETKGNLTKRNVLSAIATLIDPLQFLAPFTLRAKVLMQEIWMAGIGWDDPLPSQLQTKWLQWKAELPELLQFTILAAYVNQIRKKSTCTYSPMPPRRPTQPSRTLYAIILQKFYLPLASSLPKVVLRQ